MLVQECGSYLFTYFSLSPLYNYTISQLYIHESPTKHPREKILESQNTHEKKNLDPRICHENKIAPTKYPRNTQEKKFRTHEIPTRKNFEPTKYLREKKLGPWNTYKKKILDTRRHDLIIERDPRNLAHS